MIQVYARSKDGPKWKLEDYPEKLRRLIASPYPAPSEYWVLRDGDAKATVGAAVSPTHPERGYIGFFDISPATNLQLGVAALRLASDWLKTQGCSKAFGPLNLSTWFTYRYKLPATDSNEFWFEPTAPETFRNAFRDAGFVDDSLFLSEAIKTYETLEKYVKPSFDRAISNGYRFTSVDPATFVAAALPEIYPICMKSFSANYLFEPITREGFIALYSGLAGLVDLSHSQLLYEPGGKLIGFSLWIAEKRHLMLKTIAVDPAYQGKGLSNAMVWPAVQSAKDLVDHFAGVMFKADNSSASYTKHGELLWRHEYLLYRRDL